MAYLDDKMELAYKLSNDALKGQKWDTEAFLVASLLRLMGYNQDVASLDLVPESNIDEMTDTSKDLFVEYMHSKSDTALNSYLMQIYQIISELWHSVDGKQKAIINEYIAKLQDIG